MNLTKHFTLPELTVTQQRADNTPSQSVIDNLRKTAELLEEVRAIWDKPIIVTSGYRSPEVNRAVGGAQHSQHVVGQAADFLVPGLTPREVCLAIMDTDIEFNQLIWEDYNAGWTHIAWSAAPKLMAFKLPGGGEIA